MPTTSTSSTSTSTSGDTTTTVTTETSSTSGTVSGLGAYTPAQQQSLAGLYQPLPAGYMSGTNNPAVSGIMPAVNGAQSVSQNAIPNNNASDTRVRLCPQTGQEDTVYGTVGILQPLRNTGGLMFPYSPQISFVQDVDYQPVSLVHSNQDYYTYQRTPSVTLQITGKFAIQTQQDGIYTLACLHFLRTVSKMYFGDAPTATSPSPNVGVTNNNTNGIGSLAGTNRGLPPPILLLKGYGTYMFNNLRVILKTHNFNFDSQMDTVVVNTSDGGSTRLPVMFDLGMTLIVQQTPRAMRQDFNLDSFRTGALMATGGGWI